MPAGTREGGAMPGPAPELMQTAADRAFGRLAASTGTLVIEAVSNTRAQNKPFITRETPSITRETPSGAGWLRRVVLARCRNASRPVKAEACGLADGPAEPETLETTEARAIQGTGLGLPIVRQIVQMCSGRVWATSETGRGSVFHVELPLMEAASQGPSAAA